MTTNPKKSSRRTQGTPRALRSERTTPRLRSIEARLLFGFALMLGATLLVGLLHRRAVENLETTARWVEHSRRVNAALDQMMGALSEAESGHRGYLLTRSDAYLDPYTTALPRVRAHQRELRELVADAPDQLARLDLLDDTLSKKLAEMRELVEIDRTVGADQALQRLRTDRGLRLMEDARRQATAMAKREEELLALRRTAADQSREAGLRLSLWATLASGVLVLIAGTLLARSITRPLEDLLAGAEAIREGDFTRRIEGAEHASDELGLLARAFNGMASSLAEAQEEVQARRRLDDESARIVRAMQGHVDLAAFAAHALPEIFAAVDGLAGAFFVNQPNDLDDVYQRIWAQADDTSVARTVKNGDGLHGEAAASGRPLFLDAEGEAKARRDDVSSAVRLRSVLTSAEPAGLAVLPFAFEGRTFGLLEIACGRPLGEHERHLLTTVAETGGRILRTFRAGEETARLLREASDLADELQKQTEELQSLNQEIEEKHRSLEDQRAALEGSEVALREQQDELSALNEELEEQARLASARNVALERTNEEILAARELVETKVEELRLSAQFKSQFLANVSHELRTPLNSQLILSRLLQENVEGNLTPKQQEYLRTIHRSGTELLRLVDDILDLAKIEAGRLEIATEDVSIVAVLQEMEDAFREVARAKDLSFVIAQPRPDTPTHLRTDPHRLKQILKNLIGNAIKFTEKGEVVVEAGPGSGADPTIVFHVRDTGIGLSDEQRGHVFEAFRQGDGSTSRMYGGTGLGLTISRELAALLGGEIQVESKLGEGSVFSLVLSRTQETSARPDAAPVLPPVPMTGPAPVTTARGRKQREAALPGTVREAVVVTNDEDFAASIAGSAEDNGFALVRVPYDGQAHAALRRRVPSAVVLAPDGADMETASLLRAELESRKLPMHFVGSLEEPRRAAAEVALFFHRAESQRTLGRRGSEKDAVLHGKTLLLVDDDMRNIFALTAVLEREGLVVSFAEDGEAALQALDAEPGVDAILMDLMMPKMDGLATTEKLRSDPRFTATPIIAVTAKAMQGDRERCLAAGASDYITKPINVDQLLSLLRVWLYR